MNQELQLNLIRRIAVGDMLRRRAATRPRAEIIVDFIDGERHGITFERFNRDVNQLVRGLRQHGLRQHDRIALLGSNSREFLTLLMACFKGGFVAVPVNYLQAHDLIAYNLIDSGARAIFADHVLQPLLKGIFVSQPVDGRVLGELVGSSAQEEDPLFSPFGAFLDGQSDAEIEDVIIDDDDLAQIMYTSGTTARPKGVMNSHKNLVLAAMSGAITLGLGKDNGNGLGLLPMFHITAEIGFLTNLNLGGKTVLMRGFDADRLLYLIEHERLSGMVLLPMMWKALLASPRIGDYDYSSLRSALYAMAPMDAPTLERLERTFGCKFMIGSGQTETAAVSCTLGGEWSGIKIGNYWGEGAICTDMAIMDDEGRILGPNQLGEIVWRSPQVMLGYYRNDDATAESRAHGWHHSGDLGFVDEDGQVCFVDRKKDIVKSGGENVSSVHVERTLLGFPGVRNCAVIGLPHERWGEAVTAVVETDPGEELDEDSLLEWCDDKLGGFEKPKRIVFIDQLPLTATGKVQKQDLRVRFSDLYG